MKLQLERRPGRPERLGRSKSISWFCNVIIENNFNNSRICTNLTSHGLFGSYNSLGLLGGLSSLGGKLGGCLLGGLCSSASLGILGRFGLVGCLLGDGCSSTSSASVSAGSTSVARSTRWGSISTAGKTALVLINPINFCLDVIQLDVIVGQVVLNLPGCMSSPAPQLRTQQLQIKKNKKKY
jgi:hypothetical protein